MKKIILNNSLYGLNIIYSHARVLTKEDSLNIGLLSKNATSVILGFKELRYSNDLWTNSAQVNLTRNLLCLGHKFNNSSSIFSELEVEYAKYRKWIN